MQHDCIKDTATTKNEFGLNIAIDPSILCCKVEGDLDSNDVLPSSDEHFGNCQEKNVQPNDHDSNDVLPSSDKKITYQYQLQDHGTVVIVKRQIYSLIFTHLNSRVVVFIKIKCQCQRRARQVVVSEKEKRMVVAQIVKRSHVTIYHQYATKN